MSSAPWAGGGCDSGTLHTWRNPSGVRRTFRCVREVSVRSLALAWQARERTETWQL